MTEPSKSIVLNVDDDEAKRYFKSRMLEQAGFAVVACRTGAEALELARTAGPDVILLDIHLPDLDGRDVCRRLKADPATACIMVLEMSASSVSRDDRVRALDDGADAFLAEPVEPQELAATVNALLKLKRREEENRELLARLRQSEERLRLTIEGVKDYAIFALDREGSIASWNTGAECLTGYGAQEVLGRSISCLYPEEAVTLGRPEQDLRTAVDRSERDGWLVRKDGTKFWANIVLTGLHDSPQVVRGFSVVIRDMTARKQAEEALRSSERLFRAVFDQAAVGMCLIGADGRLTQVNDKLCDILASDAGQLTGRSLLDLTHPDDRPQNEAWVSRLLLGGVADFSLDQRLIRADDDTVWVTVTMNVLWDAGGRLEHMIAVIQDITGRKRAELALRAAEQARREGERRLRFALESSDMVAWEWNPATDELIQSLNADRILGLPRATTLHTGRAFFNVIHPDDAARVVAALKDAAAKRIGYEEDFRIVRGDGSVRWITDRGRVSEDEESGGAVRVSGVMRDITDRKRVEHQLRQLTEDLERRVMERTKQLVRSQEQLRALASELSLAEQRERRQLAYELHDHLAQLLVAIRLKLHHARKAGRGRAAESLLQEADELLDQGLSYTRSLVAELSPQILYESGLPKALEWLGDTMKQHGLSVELSVRADRVPLPDDQAILLFQSVRELLFNVVKHAGTDRAWVTLDVTKERDCRITVRDVGRGFDQAMPRNGGHRFGLFSIRERMEAIGGRLELDSIAGKGTTATVVLPLVEEARGRSSGKPVGEGAGKASRIAPGTDQRLPASGPASVGRRLSRTVRVLLVDDHAMVRQGLRSILDCYQDVEVTGEAGDGEEAMVLADSLSPDVVIMDIGLPKVSGIEATRRIKERHPDTVIIGLSVHENPDLAGQMSEAGASGYIPKDCAIERLHEAIVEAVK